MAARTCWPLQVAVAARIDQNDNSFASPSCAKVGGRRWGTPRSRNLPLCIQRLQEGQHVFLQPGPARFQVGQLRRETLCVFRQRRCLRFRVCDVLLPVQAEEAARVVILPNSGWPRRPPGPVREVGRKPRPATPRRRPLLLGAGVERNAAAAVGQVPQQMGLDRVPAIRLVHGRSGRPRVAFHAASVAAEGFGLAAAWPAAAISLARAARSAGMQCRWA